MVWQAVVSHSCTVESINKLVQLASSNSASPDEIAIVGTTTLVVITMYGFTIGYELQTSDKLKIIKV